MSFRPDYLGGGFPATFTNVTVTGDLTVQGSINFGDAGVDIMTIAGYLQGSASGNTYVSIGVPGTSHTLNATNDLYIAGELEVDGVSFFDGNVGIGIVPTVPLHVSGNAKIAGTISAEVTNGTAVDMGFVTKFDYRSTYGQMSLGLRDAVGRSLVIADYDLANKDYDHAAQANPTLFINSATDPDTANDEWLSITHDQTNAVFGLGSGAYTFPDGNVGIGTNDFDGTPAIGRLIVQGERTDGTAPYNFVMRDSAGLNVAWFDNNGALFSTIAESQFNSIAFTGATGIRSGTGLDLSINAPSGQAINFNVDGNQVMTINDNDKVGVNTDTPHRSFTANTKTDLTTGVATSLETSHTTTGVPASGFGSAIEFLGETAEGFEDYQMVRISGVLTSTPIATATSDFVIENRLNNSAYTERMRITGAGNVGIGTDSPEAKFHIASAGATTQTKSYIDCYSADASVYGPYQYFRQSNSNTLGTKTETVNNTVLGSTLYQGVNSSSAFASAAQIQVVQIGSSGATYVPAEFRFRTSDGTANVATRMTIKSDGVINIANIPTSAAGLSSGDLWSNSGVINIVA